MSEGLQGLPQHAGQMPGQMPPTATDGTDYANVIRLLEIRCKESTVVFCKHTVYKNSRGRGDVGY